MKKKLIAIFFIVSLIGSISITQGYALFEKTKYKTSLYGVEWAKTYGGDEFDMFHCVHQTNDEGYIVSGISELSDNYYPILMKLNSEGDEIWTWTIQEILYENEVYDIKEVYPIFTDQVSDGGYLFCIWLDINYLESIVTIAGLFKINQNGNLEWNQFYSEGFEWVFRPISFIEIEEGYAIPGTSGDPASYMGEKACFLKTDKTGIEQWHKEYDFGDADQNDNRMEAVCQTNDNGFILGGWGSDTSYDYWMIKTDENGNMLWDKTFGGIGDDYGHTKQCYQASDGGYVTGGSTSSFGAGRLDMWIFKTDSTGNMLWDKTYGGDKNDLCWSFESTDDGGYVAVVTIDYGGFTGDKDDINLVKLDSNGNIVWVQEYGGPDIQVGSSIDGTTDGGFIVSGCTGAFYSSKSDGLLVKFALFENQRPNKPSKPSGSNRGKPDTEYIFSTTADDPDGDQIYYKWDWGDKNFSEWLDTPECYYSWNEKGSYEIRVQIKDEHGGESDWSDPLSINIPKNKIKDVLLNRIVSNNQHLSIILQMIFRFLINNIGGRI